MICKLDTLPTVTLAPVKATLPVADKMPVVMLAAVTFAVIEILPPAILPVVL